MANIEEEILDDDDDYDDSESNKEEVEEEILDDDDDYDDSESNKDEEDEDEEEETFDDDQEEEILDDGDNERTVISSCNGFLLSCIFRTNRPHVNVYFEQDILSIKQIEKNTKLPDYQIDHIIALEFAAKAFRDWISSRDPSIHRVCKVGSLIKYHLNHSNNLCAVPHNINKKENIKTKLIIVYLTLCIPRMINTLDSLKSDYSVPLSFTNNLVELLNIGYIKKSNEVIQSKKFKLKQLPEFQFYNDNFHDIINNLLRY
ncbi:G-protein-coupled receptor [Tieghemostelium lacteum]|uniref:G-protein-coupled receptor n=1 Tax=Tieghemostelium lacteum TaxID=361077 RepID=A0A151Z5D6_TIELA|nr:G-protein-coupled receptor [Tieghemostelium lacteum]|eukprot:KYQ89180.1 G-protein-coupled receptor [Tieghemostelium lacteum]